ncbi:MAG: hypothetical protein GIX03_12330 [Candidatus Eremiobacteraeota bacterium]|nr:hypothetical protein [Candidatus Eremiobacteraeota bacterium]MBC5803751.1 hypothetical protein [Candidatus Eremiobacteraeota bacterium]MBC5822999.1 hypothetical protein [Candidatus Eremiobacteraeota bacterium]
MSTRRYLSRLAGVAALTTALLPIALVPAAANTALPSSHVATVQAPAGSTAREHAGGATTVVAQNGGAATENNSGGAAGGQNSGGIATANGTANGGGGGGGLWGLVGLLGLFGLLGMRRNAGARPGVVTTTSTPPVR